MRRRRKEEEASGVAGLEAVVSGAADSAVEDSEAEVLEWGGLADLEAGSRAAGSDAQAGRVDVGLEEAGGGAAGDGAFLLL
jgi:hypothetical protein